MEGDGVSTCLLELLCQLGPRRLGSLARVLQIFRFGRLVHLYRAFKFTAQHTQRNTHSATHTAQHTQRNTHSAAHTAQHSTAQHSAAQHSTAQHSAVQHSPSYRQVHIAR
jgi:hypothetical protein